MEEKKKDRYEYIYEPSDTVKIGKAVAVGVLILFAIAAIVFMAIMTSAAKEFKFMFLIEGIGILALGFIPFAIIIMLTRVTECQEQIAELTHAIFNRVDERL